MATSPAVPKSKRKQTTMNSFDPYAKKQRLESQLNAMLNEGALPCQFPPASHSTIEETPGPPGHFRSNGQAEQHNESSSLPVHIAPASRARVHANMTSKSVTTTKDEAATNLNSHWDALLPTLVEDMLEYYAASTGR
ncbi:hypothetical protein NLJ89_g9709 [Agrocybe chaxingu]|uniref:Uncharacterized protein n=1 Tax=Agrocybe chaxingu TaxID=84603 RepID=A0A9W8JSQ8_9AGAR|nr:hypothetical protein NLJ89_g9709 [Agrocybe chaxingu]